MNDSKLQIKDVNQDDQAEIMQYINELELQLNKFESHSRVKRGLVNLVGKVNKYLWGTLDSDDLEQINTKFETLLSNQDQIQEVINERTTLLKNITKSFEKTTQELLENQKQISTKINLYNRKINTIKFKLLLQRCITNLEFLNEAIQLSHFGISSPFLISKDLISEMTNELRGLYKREQLLNLDINYSMISIIRTDISILKDSLLLQFSYPIFHNTNYNQYKLIPIPLVNFTIVPPNPIILLSEDTRSSLWYKEECQSLEEYSLCLDEPPQRIEDTCYGSLLQGQPGLCPRTKIHLNQSFIDTIYDKLIIVPINENILVKETCSQHLTKTSISTPTMIILNNRCTTEIRDEVLSAPVSKLPPQTIMLPKPNYSNFSMDISDKSLLYLEDIERSAANLPQVHIRHFPYYDSTNFWIWFTIGTILVILILCKIRTKCHICLRCNPCNGICQRVTGRQSPTLKEEATRSSSSEPVASRSNNVEPTPRLQILRNPF